MGEISSGGTHQSTNGNFLDRYRQGGIQRSGRDGRAASHRGGEAAIDFSGDFQSPVSGDVAVLQDGVTGVI